MHKESFASQIPAWFFGALLLIFIALVVVLMITGIGVTFKDRIAFIPAQAEVRYGVADADKPFIHTSGTGDWDCRWDDNNRRFHVTFDGQMPCLPVVIAGTYGSGAGVVSVEGVSKEEFFVLIHDANDPANPTRGNFSFIAMCR